MSADREATRIVRSWLKTEEHESAELVLGAVLDRLDTTPQRRHRWLAWRRTLVSNNLRVALAGVAVLAIAAIGLGLYASRPAAVGSDPTASPTLAPSPSASVTAAPSLAGFGFNGALLAPGTYVSSAPFPVRVELTLAEEWRMWSNIGLESLAIYQESPDPPVGRGIVLAIVQSVYANACNTAAGLDEPGPTTNDLADALAGQPGTEASELSEITVDGYQATYVEYTFSSDGAGCDSLRRWPSVQGSREALDGEHDQLWIVDVDGTRLVIDAFSFAGTRAADLDEMRQIVETMQLSPVP